MGEEKDWTAQVMHLAVAAVQIASLLIIADQLQLDIAGALREKVERFKRWQRHQEFELFYRLVWPTKHREDTGGNGE